MMSLLNGRFFFSLIVLISIATCAGCSSSKSRVGGVLNLDTDLTLTLVADGNINPDDNKRPSPVFIRLYELKSPTAFNKADFIDLYERDEELIGRDLIGKQVLKALTPGEERVEKMVLQSGTRYIALYAEFSQYRGASYKVIFPVTENNVIKNKATIRISGTHLSLDKK